MQVDNSQAGLSLNKISVDEVLDYNYCPMYYKLKYDNPETENIIEAYNRIIRKCFSSYLNLLKGSSSVDVGYLTKLWGKYWIKDKCMVKLIARPSSNIRDTHDTLRKTGIDTLISFHNLIKIGSQYPILINKQYSVNITPNIVLTGNWEYIRELRIDNENTIFQIIKFNHKKDKFQTLMQMRHDIELTAAAYAFENIFTAPQHQVVYANIYKEKMIPSYRDENDYRMLKQTVIDTVKCIKNNIYPISPDIKCYHCSYRNQCEDYIKNRKEESLCKTQ